MDQIGLTELEAVMLQKRLQFLRDQGATGTLTYPLADNFFALMEDHWTFCSALSDIYAVKEMRDQRRDDEVAATLPCSGDMERWVEEQFQTDASEEVQAYVERLSAGADAHEVDDFLRSPDVEE